MKRLCYYVLGPNHEVILTKSVARWAEMMESADRVVGNTMIGETRISTVFLGIDHGLDASRPLFFETMVFGGPLDQAQWRCSTWEEAEAQHREVVKQVTRAQLVRVVK